MRCLRGAASALILSFTVSVTGCARGGEAAAPLDPRAFADRAKQVADAWVAAIDASHPWRDAFVPLDDLTVAPESGFADYDLGFAFKSGWYRTAAALPQRSPAPGWITFPDGSTMTVPLIGAKSAYDLLHRGEPPCDRYPAPVSPTTRSAASSPAGGPVGAPAVHTCAHLTVTGARLGTTTMRTSRGAAEVPAWLFTVAELPVPIARIAVDGSAVTSPPAVSVPPLKSELANGFAAAQGPVTARNTTLSFTVGLGDCEGEPTGAAYEVGNLVITAATRNRLPAQGACSLVGTQQPVTVTLKKPLGGRLLLDAVTGAALR